MKESGARGLPQLNVVPPAGAWGWLVSWASTGLRPVPRGVSPPLGAEENKPTSRAPQREGPRLQEQLKRQALRDLLNPRRG